MNISNNSSSKQMERIHNQAARNNGCLVSTQKGKANTASDKTSLQIFLDLWAENPEKAKDHMILKIYKNSSLVPSLLGKARRFERHFYMNAKPTNGATTLPPIPVVFHASLSAARRYMKQCYCPTNACAKKVDCVTLKHLFLHTEDRILRTINLVFKATYGTDNMDMIQLIRDRIQKIGKKKRQDIANLERQIKSLPAGKKGRARRIALNDQLNVRKKKFEKTTTGCSEHNKKHF